MADKKKDLKTVANTRLTRAVSAISSVGGLRSFKPNARQQKYIIDKLKEAVMEAEKEMAKTTAKSEPAFTLPD